MDEQIPPAAAEPAGSQHPSEPRRSHVGAIVASIAGGVLLLGLVFAGGAAVGFWAGAHSGGFGMRSASFTDDRPHPGWNHRQPGDDRGQDGRSLPGDRDDQDGPSDQSTPTAP
ncbi:hypothetical protein ACSBPH_06910 [Microbacterium sp. F51-2R]|jgi:hypothetical protein|uniref:hypothetical protein n=1 Tax=Microbacterium sp. F51-2R TaxID=3445777 RepID=UPI003FA0E78F